MVFSTLLVYIYTLSPPFFPSCFFPRDWVLGRMLGLSIVCAVFCGFFFLFCLFRWGSFDTLRWRKPCWFTGPHTYTTNRNVAQKRIGSNRLYIFFASIFFSFVFLSFLFSLKVHQILGVEDCISAVMSVVSSVLITYSLSVVTQWFLF